jgi:raffinose/stachyose/melibiose transport system substrate-binding protein
MNRAMAAGLGFVALSLASSWAAAADAPFSPGDVKGKITYYTHWTSYITDGLFAKWVAEFKKEYPGVTDVDVEGITTYQETMATRLSTGDYGDVLDTPPTVSNDELPDFFLPLDNLGLDNDFHYAATWAVDGKHYAFPFGVNVEALVYNKAAFKKAGITAVPTTYTDFIADCKKLKDAGTIPVILNMGATWPLTTFDGLALDISGDPNFFNDMLKDNAPFSADKPYGKSFGILHQLIADKLTEPDLTSNNWEDSKGWIASGKGAMWFLGNWSINQIIQEGGPKAGMNNYDPNNIGFFPFPYDDKDSGHFNVNSGPDYAMSVAKNSSNPATAEAWLKFLLTQSDLPQIAGFIPGYKSMQPTLPQLTELNTYHPNIIEQVSPNSAYVDAMNLINFSGGHGTQAVMLADDYAAAIQKLNQSWADAVAQGQ